MTLYEFSIIVLALVTLTVLRFGVPALVMWLLTIISHRLMHA